MKAKIRDEKWKTEREGDAVNQKETEKLHRNVKIDKMIEKERKKKRLLKRNCKRHLFEKNARNKSYEFYQCLQNKNSEMIFLEFIINL